MLDIKKSILNYINECIVEESKKLEFNSIIKNSKETKDSIYLEKSQLDKIKKLTGIKNYALFLSLSPPKNQEDLKNFRMNKETKSIDKNIYQCIEDVNIKRMFYLELLEELKEKKLNYKKFIDNEFNKFTKNKFNLVKEIAEKARNSFDDFFSTFDKSENSDIFFNRICLWLEKNGYLVYTKESHKSIKDFSGVFIHKKEYPIILVMSEYSRKRANFTLLHEFAHSILEDSSTIDSLRRYPNSFTDSKVESWCNNFAANFLMPENIFKEKVEKLKNNKQDLSSKDIESLSKDFYASKESIIYRLYNLKIIKETRKENLLTKLDKNRKSNSNFAPKRSPYSYITNNGINQTNKFLYAYNNNIISSNLFYKFLDKNSKFKVNDIENTFFLGNFL